MKKAYKNRHFDGGDPGRCLCARKYLTAFTLVELLVVTLIISLLVGILLPSLRKSIRQARSAVCKSNLKDLYRSLDMYHTENKGWLPAGDPNAVDLPPEQSWPVLLFADNPAGRSVLVCPEDPWGTIIRNNITLNRFDSAGVTSYGLNDFMASSPGSFLLHWDRFTPKRPGDNILVADMGPDYVVQRATSGTTILPSRHRGLLGVDDGYRPGSPATQRQEPWLSGRHSSKINVLTHVGNVKEVNTLPTLSRQVKVYYPACAAQFCTMCCDLEIPHYSFAESQTFWWTGSIPAP